MKDEGGKQKDERHAIQARTAQGSIALLSSLRPFAFRLCFSASLVEDERLDNLFVIGFVNVDELDGVLGVALHALD
jgi:hypothetical protein